MFLNLKENSETGLQIQKFHCFMNNSLPHELIRTASDKL